MSDFWRGNTRDVEEGGSIKMPPLGRNHLRIIEAEKTTTKAGDPMAKIKMEVVGEGSYGHVWDNIVFPLSTSPAIKILGRSKHFLHCISEPYDEEDLRPDPDNWIGLKIWVDIKHETYENKYGVTKPKAVIAGYLLPEMPHPQQAAATPVEQTDWDK